MMSCGEGIDYGVFEPWNCTPRACVSHMDCRFNTWGEVLVRGRCVRNMDYFSEFPATKFVQYCVCDQNMALVGRKCDVETTVTNLFRYLRMIIVLLEFVHLTVGVLTIYQARKHKVFGVRPLWFALAMAILGIASHIIWNVSFILIGIGTISPRVQLGLQNMAKVLVPITTFFLLAESLTTSLTWLEILDTQKSTWIVFGRVGLRSVQVVTILGIILVVPMLLFFQNAQLDRAYIVTLPFIVITTISYIVVLSKVNTVYKSVEGVEHDLAEATIHSKDDFESSSTRNNTGSGGREPDYESYEIIPFWSCFCTKGVFSSLSDPDLNSNTKSKSSKSAGRQDTLPEGSSVDGEAAPTPVQSRRDHSRSFVAGRRRKQTSYLLQNLELISGAAVTMTIALALLLVGGTLCFFIIGMHTHMYLRGALKFVIALGILLVHVSVVMYCRNLFLTVLSFRRFRRQALNEIQDSIDSIESGRPLNQPRESGHSNRHRRSSL